MADGARLSAFISISISTHFVFQAEIKITEAVPGRGSATPRAPALLRVLTELPAAKPRTTYSCGSLVHPCGWCFARLEDEGFFAFCFSWNIALLFATFSGHVSSWDVWASPSPVSIHANPPGLLGKACGDTQCHPWAPTNGMKQDALRALEDACSFLLEGRCDAHPSFHLAVS